VKSFCSKILEHSREAAEHLQPRAQDSLPFFGAVENGTALKGIPA
jgi:hypothetical protein